MKKLHFIALALILFGCGMSDRDKADQTINSAIILAEQMDKANESEFYRGEEYYREMKYELETTSYDPEMKSKRQKLLRIMKNVEIIENSCGDIISEIEELKIALLRDNAESVSKENHQNPSVIIWRKHDSENKCLPSRLNLAALKRPKAIVEGCYNLATDECNQLSNFGRKLTQAFTKNRRIVVQYTGSYSFGKQDFSIDVKPINSFKNQKELLEKVTKMVDQSNANLKEDRQVLIDLYVNLTNPKYVLKDGVKCHWVNATFGDLSIVSVLATLSALENEILRARTLAFAHWRSRTGHCCYAFDQISAIATGPSLIKEGQNLELNVTVGAFDSSKKPKITVEGYDANIDYYDGMGIVSIKPKKGIQTIRGTVTIKNNSGVAETKPWEWNVIVTEK